MNELPSILPGGYVDVEGNLHRKIDVVPLSGREEELLASSCNSETASLVTTVLSRCVRRIGNISPVSEQVARNLLVADRQYLLLKLREVTFGDRVSASILCPWPDCGKRVSIAFSVADIPFVESQEKGPLFKRTMSPEAAPPGEDSLMSREIIFRLPSGEDQEVVSPLLSQNEAMALTTLLSRCVIQIGDMDHPGPEAMANLPSLTRMEIERHMESTAPKIQMEMDAGCPECGRQFIIPFDPQAIFFGDLRISKDLLLREIHYLAFHYHWSEREIMEMTREKRRGYIEVLADEIERFNNAV